MAISFSQIYGETSAALKTCHQNVESIERRINSLTAWNEELSNEIAQNLYNFIASFQPGLTNLKASYRSISSKYSTNELIHRTLSKYQEFTQSDFNTISEYLNLFIGQKILQVSELHENDLSAIKARLSQINREVKQDCTTCEGFFVHILASHKKLIADLEKADHENVVVVLLDQPKTQRFHFVEFPLDARIDSLFKKMDSTHSLHTPVQQHTGGWKEVETQFSGKIEVLRGVLRSAHDEINSTIDQLHSNTKGPATSKGKVIVDVKDPAILKGEVITVVASGQRALDDLVHKFNADKAASIADFGHVMTTKPDAMTYQPGIMVDSRVAYTLYGILANSEVNTHLEILHTKNHHHSG